MRRWLFAVWMMLALSKSVLAADESASRTSVQALRAGASIFLDCPQCPPTLLQVFQPAAAVGHSEPPRLGARLPDNYSPDGKFPLFVYLGPGWGGEPKSGLIDALRIAGSKDYILVSMPLFKKRAPDSNEPGEPAQGECLRGCFAPPC